MFERLTRAWRGGHKSPDSLSPVQRELADRSGPLRRVVTGLDAEGKSTVVMDGAPPLRATYNVAGEYHGYNAWLLNAVPADLTSTSDPVIGGHDPTEPPPGGVVARITTFMPDFTWPMHKTDTIDFGIVLSGRIELGLETGTVLLNPGDLVVQRGTLHSWRAVGGPSTVVFILVDAKP